ncbi:hypothetical protein [Chamaesiphon sp. VAR_69_metabat_338]|uniref:hypothetical protein n=1 Tax=Chamaesiphon sp. VAR_69_metabat_338 TaxID=2964704 RepID=UPI00286EA75B|nr:hypothetical protein [Chamaesiphon sp. VAR_69_metabat_338]
MNLYEYYIVLDRLAGSAIRIVRCGRAQTLLSIECRSTNMSQLATLRILPLLTLISPLAAFAVESAPTVPMALGKEYTGVLAASPNNPQGEVCYGLSAEPNTRITLKVKTGGAGILKFAIYDQQKALRFFHNNAIGKSQANVSTLVESRFSFPAVSEVSHICLTTTNPGRGQRYDFMATATPGRKSKSRLVLRPVDVNKIAAIPPAKIQLAAVTPTPETAPPPPPPPAPSELLQTKEVTNPTPPPQPLPTKEAKNPSAPAVPLPPQPTGEPYCYVGTWQVADLSGYWQPVIQTFTQAKVTDPQMLGYAKLTIERNGNAAFEAVDLEQRYTLKTKETGARIDRIGVGLSGSASARFQVNPDSTLTFNSQNYQRLNAKLTLGDSLKLTGDRLFVIFGDRDKPAIKSAYKCLDRDNVTLKIPLPTGQKTISILLKRIN